MLEQYSERMRKIMILADQEAQRLGHDFIAPEHLLLGMVKRGAGVGATALKNLGVEMKQVRHAVESAVEPGNKPSEPEHLVLTPQAKAVLDEAVKEARHHEEHLVGSEHLLLALLQDGSAIPAQVLTDLGITTEKVRTAVSEVFGDVGEHD